MMLPSFPLAQQAQIIRASQRDLIQVSSLREDVENVLRSWIGTRRLARWTPEVDFFIKVLYHGLTTGRATQTLGEEYTDIWPRSFGTHHIPSRSRLALLVLLPTLPSYLLARLGSRLPLDSAFRKLPTALEIVAEVNLALFYIRGTYHELVKRLLGVQYISSVPDDPNTRPPSYSLLGVLIGIRVLHRLVVYLRSQPRFAASSIKGKEAVPPNSQGETYIDDQPVSALLSTALELEGAPAPRAEDDQRTWLDMAAVPSAIRASRVCTLCLEERTATAATECGHLFCWNCIFGWGREKAECPLCRQSLSLTKLLPIYNL